MDIFDPFTLLTARPPNAAWTWRDPGHSFTPRVHPTAQAELRGVGCVMIPRQPIKPRATAGLPALYGGNLDAHFPRIRLSKDWILRLPASAGGGETPSCA